MDDLKESIIGYKIKKVFYSEFNNPLGKIYFKGFDVFDYGINFEMENGFCWHFYWKEEEFFEINKDRYYNNKLTNKNDVTIFDASERWKNVLDKNISHFNIIYFDEAKLFPSRINLRFENEKEVVILVNEELNLDETIPYPIQYLLNGEIYVFFNLKLLINSNR